MTYPLLCIYCKKTIQNETDDLQNSNKSPTKKGRNPVEHVIPQMLGLFGKDTMTLLKEVCPNCNNRFSKLELMMGRDSVYGILYRRLSGILNNEKSLQHKRKKLFFEVYSPVYGKTLVDISPDDAHLFKVRIADQFTLLNSTKGLQVNYHLEQLPRREELESLGLPMRPANNIGFLGAECTLLELSEKMNEVKQALRKSGIKPSGLATANRLPPLPENSPLMFSSMIDDNIMRIIAKIAFNYFVSRFGYRVAMGEYFDQIRNYVLYGLRTEYNIVSMVHRSILEHADNLSKEQFGHHLVSVFQDGQKIIANILLFNRDNFKVIISSHYPLYSYVFFSKHKFNILKKQVETY